MFNEIGGNEELTINFIMLAIAALLLGADFALNKVYQRAYGATPKSPFYFNALLGLFTFLVFFAANGFRLAFTPFSAVLAALMSLFVMSYNVIGFRILKHSGSVAVYTLYLMTGGMILPYLWGVAFLNERLSVSKIVGLAVIAAGVILPNLSGKRNTDVKQLVMCAAVFVLNGCVSIVSKMHQIEAVYRTVGTIDFVALGGMFKFLFAGALFLLFKRPDASKGRISAKAAVIIALASAVVGGGSYALQLLGAKSVPATVLYPFITGGSIVFSALADAIVFKKRISGRLAASVLLCFFGTLLFI